MTPATVRARLDALGISRPGASTRQAALSFADTMRALGDERPPTTIQRQMEGWLLGETATVPGWLVVLLTLMERTPLQKAC